MRIQSINYSTNNYSAKLNQTPQQNPSFGKLIINKYVPSDILQDVIKNEELCKLIKMFHGIHKDVELCYSGVRSKFDEEYLWFNTLDKKYGFYDGLVAHFYKRYDTPSIGEQLDSLEEGFAEKFFEKYKLEKAKKAEADSHRQEILEYIDAFNESLLA